MKIKFGGIENVCTFVNTKQQQTFKNMKIEMSLISRGVKVVRICTTEFQVYQFERDMPARYDLLFSKTPYIIGKKNLNNL